MLMLGTTLAAGMDINGVDVKIIGGGDLRKSSEKLGGTQGYSVQVGDTFYSFNRMDPFGMFLGLAADFHAISGQVDESTMGDLVVAATLSMSRNLASKSYLSGITDLVESMVELSRGNTHQAIKYLNNQGASLVPFQTAFNTAKKIDDPVQREVWDLVDAVKAKLPGFSTDVPPARNLFGEEVILKGGLGPDIMSPVITSVEPTVPAAKEIARLNVDLSMPSRTISPAPGAPSIDLDKWQYDKLSQMTGDMFKSKVGELIATQRYQDLPEDPSGGLYREAKEKVLRDLHSNVKSAMLQKLIREDEELKTKWRTIRQNAGGVFKGITPFAVQ
jgi:hypothetical protein